MVIGLRAAALVVGCFVSIADAQAQQVSARCMIEVATATNEQHLLTQDAGRQAAERKAAQLRREVRALADRLDAEFYTFDEEMRRQRDFLTNGLITQAEYDQAAARAPDVSELAAMLRAYPSCGFIAGYESYRRSMRQILGGSARR